MVSEYRVGRWKRERQSSSWAGETGKSEEGRMLRITLTRMASLPSKTMVMYGPELLTSAKSLSRAQHWWVSSNQEPESRTSLLLASG